MSNILNERHLGVAAAPLEPRDAPGPNAGQISSLALWERDGQRHGLWQMTPGLLPGVRGPESVVLLSGRARVTVEPAGQTYEVAEGDTFILDAGETATWEVLETVRKFYVVNG